MVKDANPDEPSSPPSALGPSPATRASTRTGGHGRAMGDGDGAEAGARLSVACALLGVPQRRFVAGAQCTEGPWLTPCMLPPQGYRTPWPIISVLGISCSMLQ